MITKEKIAVYQYYGGDVDGFARARAAQRRLMTDSDFAVIAGFVQDLQIIRNGLASIEFKQKIEKALAENCDGPETVELLNRI